MDSRLSSRLDGLRGLCALIVFFAHLNQIFILPIMGVNSLPRWLGGVLASYAVLAFFVLSGFVITLSILRDHVSGNFSYRRFASNRFGRIYPPFIFSIALGLLVYYAANAFDMHGAITFKTAEDIYLARSGFSRDNWIVYLRNSLFLHGLVPSWTTISLNGPLWSVTYEVWFYVIAMFFGGWVLRRRIVFGAVPFLAVVFFLYLLGNSMFFFLLAAWLMGAAFALFAHYNISVPARFVVPVVLLLVLIVLNEFRENLSVFKPYEGLSSFLVQLAVVLVFSVLFSLFWRRLSFLSIFKGSAAFSYTLYVCHFPLLLFSFSLGHEAFMGSGGVMRFVILSAVSFSVIYFCKIVSVPLENKSVYAKLARRAMTVRS